MHTVNKTLLENDIDNHLDIPFGVSATAFHFLQIAGFFANFAGILPLCFTNEPFSEMARMDTYVRFVPFPY